MILTCPDCSTRYSIKDGAIGPNGRTVRCSNCSATWFVSQEADALALTDLQREDVERIDPPTPPRRDIPLPPDTPDTDFDAFDASGPEQDSANTDTLARGAHVDFRDKVDRERRHRRMMGVSMIWVVALGLLGTAAVLGYVFRQDIVSRNNGLASIYKAFNISVTENGLKFEDPATSHIIVDGRPVLVVEGVVMNTSNQNRPVPMIELSFVNASGDKVAAWRVDPPKAELAPGERMEYSSQYPNPPLDAKELEYNFVNE